MTFEEFFKKKKIDLPALQNGEPALFAEFENHFNQMGEKSFDHTKKYWFNKLRLRFPAPIEPKVEKVHIENQLAEQTITESLVEATTPTPSVGFKPRFKAGITSKTTEEKPVEEQPAPVEEKPVETPPATPTVGFKPRFKASMVAKPAEDKPAETEIKTEAPTEEPAAPKPAVGFKPRFKASMVTKPAEEITSEPEVTKEEPTEDKPTEAAPKPMGFKPRFKAKE